MLRKMSSWVLSISMDVDFTASSGIFSVFSPPHSKKIFSYILINFSYCSTASCPVTGHPWKKPSSLHPPFRYLCTLLRSALRLLFFRLSNSNSLSFSFHDRCFSHLCDPAKLFKYLWPHQVLNICVYGTVDKYLFLNLI